VSRRNAFTLVEILFATTIGTVVIGAAALIWSIAGRSQSVAASASSLQTALAIEERVLSDLARLVVAAPGLWRFRPEKPTRLSFYAYAGGPSGLEVPARGVTYSLEGTPARFTRWQAGKSETVGTSPLESLRFHPFETPTGPMIRVTVVVGRNASDPAGPSRTHTFLAPVACPRQSPILTVKRLSDFPTPEDMPGIEAPANLPVQATPEK
jgi:type II secretory pathway pseudopilin PulG